MTNNEFRSLLKKHNVSFSEDPEYYYILKSIYVSKKVENCFDININLYGKDDVRLLEWILDYIKTPIQNRTTKYFLLSIKNVSPHIEDRYLNYSRPDGYFFFGSDENGEDFQTLFTQEEIKRIPFDISFLETELIAEEV